MKIDTQYRCTGVAQIIDQVLNVEGHDDSKSEAECGCTSEEKILWKYSFERIPSTDARASVMLASKDASAVAGTPGDLIWSPLNDVKEAITETRQNFVVGQIYKHTSELFGD